MTSVSIPASVQNIDAAFFQLFPNATAVNVAPENPNYKSYNGMLFNADLTNLLLVPEGMEGVAVLPDSLATVPACLFSRCNKLSAIQGSAGNDTFTTRDGILYTKDKTTLVAAPAGLGIAATIAPECTVIAEGAFAGNFWLDTVVANSNAMEISPVAFEVKAVENATVVLPAVNSEDEVAEGEGTEADAIDAARASWEAAGFTKFAEGAKTGDAIAPAEGSGFAFDVMENNKLAVRWQGEDPAPANLQIPLYGEIDGVRYDVVAIADEGFAGQTEIKRVDLPSTIQTIGAKAFADATALHTISIPGNVTSIGDNAFTNCQSLVALTLNEGLRSIGNGAFSGISQATVVLPASVKSVGDYAFANSPNLKNIVALGQVSVVSTSALMGISGSSVYVPYNEQGMYAWHVGSPAQANHLYPYGVKTQDETINVEVGGKANLFDDGGYLEAPGDIEVNYAYKAKPVSISEDGTVEGKAEGTTNVEVSLRLKVAKTVVPAPVSQETRLVPAAFGEDAESTEVEEVIELANANALAQTMSARAAYQEKSATIDAGGGSLGVSGNPGTYCAISTDKKTARIIWTNLFTATIMDGQYFHNHNEEYDGTQDTLNATFFALGAHRPGYRFVGWERSYVDSNGNTATETITTSQIGLVDGSTYTAIWYGATIDPGIGKLTIYGTTHNYVQYDEREGVKPGTIGVGWRNDWFGATILEPPHSNVIHTKDPYSSDLTEIYATCPGFVWDGWNVTDTSGNTSTQYGRLSLQDGYTYTARWINGVFLNGGGGTFNIKDGVSGYYYLNDDSTEGAISWSTGNFGAILGGNHDTMHVYAKNSTTNTNTIQQLFVARSGYTLAGWNRTYTDSSGKQQTVPVSFGTNNNENHNLIDGSTYTALWTANDYSLTLNYNGGTLNGYSQADLSVTTGSGANYLTGIPKRAGYTFKGFFDAEGNQAYDDGAGYTDSGAVTGKYWNGNRTDGRWCYPGDVTLYAKWEPNKYTVTLDANGGTLGAAPTQDMTFDSPGWWVIVPPKRTGYTFEGFFDANGNQAYSGGVDACTAINGVYWKGSGDTAQWQYPGDVTLYARWKANSYTVTFDANGYGSGGMIGQTQQMTYDSALPTLSNTAVPTRAGYTFEGFYKEQQCNTKYYEVKDGAVTPVNGKTWDIADAHTLYANWIANDGTEYKVIHYLEKVENADFDELPVVTKTGTSDTKVKVSEVQLNEPGFTCQTDGNTEFNINADGSQVIELYYSRNTHDVTFAYSGTVPTDAPAAPANQTSVKYGATVTVPDVRPTDFGYHVDWQNDASVNNSGTFAMPDQQVNFTGTWSGNQYYVFFYDTADANKPSAIQTLTYGKEDTLTHTATRNGYEFLGWSTEPGQGGTKFDKDKAYTHNLTTTENDYVIVYGMWKGGSFVVKYDGNGAAAGAAGSDWPTTGDLGGRVTLPANDATDGFSRPGYTFAGWSTEAGAVTAQFAGGASVQLDDYVTTEGDAKSVTLYAVWGAQINVDTTISPVIQLKVQDGKVTDAPAITAENIFASKTPANVLVSSIKCEPVEGENGTAKVFSEKDRWRLVKLQLSANGNFDEFAIDKEANAHKYTTDSSDKFIIPAAGAQDGTLPLGIKLVVPEQVTANVIDGEADVAKLLFTFQIA